MSMQVYGFWRSIASFRVRVALRLKGLPFEEVPVDILSGEQFKPGGYETINAERVVPTLIHDGHSVFQSLAIIEYLDDIQPNSRLLPQDAKDRAYARSLGLMTIADAHPLVTPRVRNHLAKMFGADVHAIDAGLFQQRRALQHLGRIDAAGWVDLDADDELPRTNLAGQRHQARESAGQERSAPPAVGVVTLLSDSAGRRSSFR